MMDRHIPLLAEGRNILDGQAVSHLSELWRRESPLLASPQGGVAASQENAAKPPKQTQTGWFSSWSLRKTTPSSRSADASRYLFDRSAIPPCGHARRGIPSPEIP